MKTNTTLISVLFAISVFFLSPTISCAQKITGGGQHSFSICSDSTLMAWGDNYNGNLGNGNTTNSNVPVHVNFLTNIIAVSGGQYHCLAINDSASGGIVWAWGANNDGQLGNGTNTVSYIAVQVSGLAGVTAIAGGGTHSLALKNDSTVWAWGWNYAGQLGNGNNNSSNVPVQVSSLTGVIAIAAGANYSIALKVDGTVWAGGANFDGQLGHGTNGAGTDCNVPVQVSSLTGIVAIGGGNSHTLALKNDGTVWAWGTNQFGTLGNGNNTNSNLPVQVSTLTDIISIEVGTYHCLALKNDSTVWAWGFNSNGQLGNGANADSNVPVLASSLTNTIAIEGGDQHSLALKSDGTVWTWGWNMYGQLGNGNNASSNVPVLVSGLCQVATSINEISELLNISIFPNPASSHFSIAIAGSNQKVQISISDITGNIIYKSTSGETNMIEMSAKDFENGLYIVRIQQAEGIEVKKLMVQK